MKSLSTLAGAATLALAAAGTAQAATYDFDFSNSGFLSASACGPTCTDVIAVGVADSTSFATSWFYDAESLVADGAKSFSGTWSLHDLLDGNDLGGTFSGVLTSLTKKGATGTISYTVSGPDLGGLFAGATGSGKTSFSVLPDLSYTETGRFSVITAPVPEPGTWAMMALGLAGLGAVARRRKAG